MAREKGILTPGLCIVADKLSAFEAYELGHHRPEVQNIKVRTKSFVGISLDESERLRDGDFHVICDGKFYFSRTDEMNDTLELFARRGLLPDAVTYAPDMTERIMFELVKEMVDGKFVHTIVLTAFLPEQMEFTSAESKDKLQERVDLADKLVGLGGRLAVYATALDFSGVDVPSEVLTIGAGIRRKSDGPFVTLADAKFIGVDIPLIGEVIGQDPQERKIYLDDIAPRA